MGSTQSVATLPVDINNKGPVQVPYIADTEPQIVLTTASSTVFSTTDAVVIRVKNLGSGRGYFAVGTAPTALATSFSLESGQDIFIAVRPGNKINVLSQTFEIAVCS